jgi:3-phenylpropionate/trans-cinnamate dioxygenase ferredoxin subunit
MSIWTKVCDTKSLKEGDLLDFDFNDKKILVLKIKDKIFALDRICTHAYADLSTGFLNEDEKTITCPLHMSSFNLLDGMPQNLPAEEPLKTYDIMIRDNFLYILM